MFYGWIEKSTSPCVPLCHPKKTIGRFRRYRAVFHAAEVDMFVPGRRRGNRNCCYDSYDSYDDKKRRKEIPWWWHFMAFYDFWEVPNKTSHCNMAWYRDFWESSEIYCLLFANFWKMRWASGITFSPAHAITLLTAHVTLRPDAAETKPKVGIQLAGNKQFGESFVPYVYNIYI